MSSSTVKMYCSKLLWGTLAASFLGTRCVRPLRAPTTNVIRSIHASHARYYATRQKHEDDDTLHGKSQRLIGRRKHIAPSYRPRGANQEAYVKALNDPEVPVVLGVGPAGCGKTLFACIAAVDALRRGDVTRIILTRPVVSVEEELGFLPGDIVRKMDPWLQPLFDVLLEFYTQRDIDGMMAGGVIEISPLGFMRGRTFKRAFVLADELQNSTPGQMLMLLTRVGSNCKLVITGDLRQSDLPGGVNGLGDFIQRYKSFRESGIVPEIHLCELDAGDVERSAVVRRVNDIYQGSTAGSSDAAMIPFSSLPKHTFSSSL